MNHNALNNRCAVISAFGESCFHYCIIGSGVRDANAGLTADRDGEATHSAGEEKQKKHVRHSLGWEMRVDLYFEFSIL